MKNVDILIGSNCIERMSMVDKALEAIADIVEIKASSCPLVTPDYTSRGDDYANLAVASTYEGDISDLEKTFERIESAMGRKRGEEATSCVEIDIDIVAVDGNVLKPIDYDLYLRAFAATQHR